MKFFIDTADVAEIREGAAMGLVDGVTTNPSLVAKFSPDLQAFRLQSACPAIVPVPILNVAKVIQARSHAMHIASFTTQRQALANHGSRRDIV